MAALDLNRHGAEQGRPAKSTDGQTWTTLATVTGAARQWTCPAGTLTSSIKYWRVRTYNADGIAGEWSDAAQIVVIAAPTAPSIQIKSTGPRPSISWQTSEQEAYQVELDGVLSGGTHYGTEKTWTSPAYLADGSHTVRVRVQINTACGRTGERQLCLSPTRRARVSR